MKIIHTEASCGWGGQEIRILSEAAGHQARGHQVVVLCPEDSRIYLEGPRRGVSTVALPIGRKNLRGLLSLRAYLKAHPADVINSHSSTDSWLAAVACATLAKAPPLVRTRHISAPVPNNASTRWLYTRATAHIATTGELLRETLVRDNGYPAGRITSVPTGIDTERFHPTDEAGRRAARAHLGLPEEALVVGIVATLRSWKGHRYLLEAVESLLARWPGLHLAVVGDGPQMAALRTQADSLDLLGHIPFAGTQDDVLPWLPAFDVFALPSYANEGVPQALLQAMLAGLPCVTTAVGSIPEIARQGETALVVPTQAIDPLVAALDQLLQAPDLRARLGAAARAHCAAHHSREAMLDRMEHIFQAVCARA